MTTIDQRILIPSPPDAVWDYISRLDSNPTWQVDCESLTFLSQKREGVGTRWRQRSVTRQEVVYEITTWYNGLGYEYVFIDGSAFQSSKGRIRLQEIPEGTIVQWTFSYEPSGVFGGLRNALTTQRRIESDMVDSLKTLWKVTKRKGSLEGYQARSLMRDGPQSPEERAVYQSRHEDTASTAETGGIHIPEPPISDEDTRPGRAVQVASAGVNSLQPTREDDNRFAPPDEGRHFDTPSVSEPTPPEQLSEEDSVFAPTESALPTVDESPVDDETMTAEPLAPSPYLETPAAEPSVSDSAIDVNLEPKVDPSTDTSGMSIWEVFGIPSPTDTQRMRAIQAAEQAEREYDAEQLDDAPDEEETETKALETVEHTTVDVTEAEAEETVATVEAQVVPDENKLDRVDTIRISDEFSPQNEGGRSGFRAKARSRMIRVRRPGS